MSELILIVEDEPDIAANLVYNFERAGYQTETFASGRAAWERLQAEPLPNLVVLDLMLPELSGTELCRLVRADEHTRSLPILMLTARGEELDRVVGFEVGADDYVVKPFSVRELLLRIKALLRRSSRSDGAGSELRYGPIRVDPSAHRVWVEDRELTLTALELRLLTAFLTRRGRVQTREVLLNDVWDMRGDLSTRTVDTHVKRLRQKLGLAGDNIETLRGVGYRLRQTPDGGRS